jgi:hypothetical protein
VIERVENHVRPELAGQVAVSANLSPFP